MAVPTQVAKVNREEAERRGPAIQAPGVISRLAEYPRRMRQFLHEVRLEMKQVTWPSRSDIYATTAVVIVTVFFFGFFLFLVDFGASHMVERVFKYFKL